MKKLDLDKENTLYLIKKYGVPISMIIIFLIGFYLVMNGSGTININLLEVSGTDNPNGSWLQSSIINVDTSNMSSNIVAYSFDNGVTWQDNNTYEAIESGIYLIRVKDNKDRVSDIYEYVLTNVDGKSPTIDISLEKEILINSTVNLETYVTVTDSDSGVKGDVIISPSTLDTSKLGPVTISYSAIDNAGNESNKEFIVTIVESLSNNVQKTSLMATEVTYYRYRTKTQSAYVCGKEDCSYVDPNITTNLITTFENNSYCCTGENCLKTNPMISTPCQINTSCSNELVEKYKISNNVCYDSTYIYIDETSQIIKTQCDSDEINIDGYCHTIESYAINTCPSNYQLSNNSCLYKVNKTCNKTCIETIWSSWSDWSTIKREVTSNMQEQIKKVQ